MIAYSLDIDDWANQVADIMIGRAASIDLDTWKAVSEKLSRGTFDLLQSASRGAVYERLKQEQVTLITSLPLEASKKVVEWTHNALITGVSSKDLTDHIFNDIGGVTRSRARLIARTETARARSNFTQARCEAVGITHYVWRTVGDNAVRDDHKELDGTVQAWDDPPVADKRTGRKAHAGTIYNCRCFASPIIPDDKEQP